MEAFGKKLTEARTARGLELDQVSRETNITRRYLEALEKEDFTAFPGEPYILGFLRNYCDYLGLNSNEIINSYKNLKIQETPIPLKDLMPTRPISDRLFLSPKASRIGFGLIVGVLALALVIGAIFLIGRLIQGRVDAQTLTDTRSPSSWEVSGDNFKERIYTGDTILVKAPSGVYKMEVRATAPALKLETPLGSRLIELGQDMLIDLSGDDIPDVKIFVADLFKNDPKRGADVQMSSGDAVAPAADTTADALATADVIVPGTPAAANSKYTVLFESGSAYPVTLNATFRGYCLFRYETDRTNRDERYYQKSELLTVQANNGIRIWASNGNSVKLQVIAGGKTVDLEVSRPGEVLVRDLKWLKDEETNRFKFVVMDID